MSGRPGLGTHPSTSDDFSRLPRSFKSGHLSVLSQVSLTVCLTPPLSVSACARCLQPDIPDAAWPASPSSRDHSDPAPPATARMRLSLSTSAAALLLPLLAASGARAAAVEPRTVSYDGYKVFRLAVGDQVDRVRAIVSDLSLATWKGAPRSNAMADIVVAPDQLDQFRARTAGLDMITMHEDLGAAIADESSFGLYAAGSANSTWFQSYHSYAEHQQWLIDVQAAFPKNTALVSAGKSLEGRDLAGIHIFGNAGKGAKPAVVFHGTVHAREWVGTMTVEYLAWTLASGYGSGETTAFVNKYDFYIFPIVNPDGFSYTQTNDRLWRKNRQPTGGSSCRGHDINRNWDFKWDVRGGASTNPCAEDFKGAAPADAPETRALASWLGATKKAQGLKLFIDFHAYSQLFMTPYGWSCTEQPERGTEMVALAKGAVAAIQKVHGTVYEAGPICTTIYQATGSSVDYVNDVVKADYTFTEELRDTGNFGFLLPASQIVPTAEETFAGVRYLLQNMK
ncbi:hypothetical protein RB601_004224 [Gaeumannomyces tritici]